MNKIGRWFAAGVLLLVAASTPVMGYGAAEQYENRKFYRVFEGDWLFAFALTAGAACVWAAVELITRKRP